MDYQKILHEMEKVFFVLGFKSISIKGINFMRYKNHYCKISFLKDLSAFVIESADSIQDAEKNLLEDGDLYYIDLPIDDLLKQLESDLIRDYLIE